MLYTTKEILKKYKNKYNLKKAVINKEIFKLDRGIYSDENILNPIIIISKKYSSAIISMDTAFYYYDLTDVIPDKIYVVTARSHNKIQRDDIIQIRTPKDKLNQGKVKVSIDGTLVNMYNKERLLVELIRKRNQIPFDYYKEIILNYRKIVDELDMYKIEEYLSLYKNEESLGNVILREVF